MDLKSALKKLEEKPLFKEWKHKNKNTYLSYAFKIPQEMDANEWQLGFYDKKKDNITTFVITGDTVNIRPEEELFKNEEMEVNEIEIDKVRMTFDNVVLKGSEFQQKNYPKDKSIKTIAILQNLPNFGNVWNLTYITESFNTLNMKIDASSGKVLEHHISSVFSFRMK